MNNLFFLFIFVPLLAFILLALNILLAPHRPDEAKVSSYECGFQPVFGQTRTSFQIHFMVVALLFLIFDLEVLLLYPLAVSLYQVSSFGLTIAIIFFLVLTIGFVLEIGSGAISLQNTDVKSKSNSNSKYNNNFTPLSLLLGNNKNKGNNNNKYNNNKYNRVNLVLVHKNKIRSNFNLNLNFSTSINFKDNNLKNIETNPLNYWKLIHEKDIGQETNNPHVIARRHITNRTPTDTKIINLVQSKLGFEQEIKKEEFEKLISIKPISLFENIGILKIRKILKSYKNITNKKIAGVYVWCNLKTGDLNVGSSIDLNTRLMHYFKPSVLNEGNRMINKNMKEFGLESFKLDIYIIDTTGMEKNKIIQFTLSLEQYYIFTLNPSLNSIKVAGSNPIVNHSEEHINKIKKANSKKVYVYKNNTLIYESNSATELIKEINISSSTVTKSLKNPSKKIFKYLNISHESPSSLIEIKKVDIKTLKDFINEYFPEEKRVKKPNKTIIMTSENGDVLSFYSINKARKHFKIRYYNISLFVDQVKPILIKGVKWVISSK